MHCYSQAYNINQTNGFYCEILSNHHRHRIQEKIKQLDMPEPFLMYHTNIHTQR